MLKLRPLIVVTGTAHVEGGERTQRTSGAGRGKKKGKKPPTQVEVTETLEISPDRRKANVIAVDYSRRVKKLAVLRTPFGMLFTPETLNKLQAVLTELTRRAVDFNKSARTAKVMNYFLWEPLAGYRKAAVEGYIALKQSECDKGVERVLPMLDEAAAAAAAAGAANGEKARAAAAAG